MKIQTYKDLFAWQEGHVLVLQVYKYTKNFPRDEQFGLTSQLKRAVVSITSNIAEGFSRRTYKEKQQFYLFAKGSLLEVDNQILIARDVGYVTDKQYEILTMQIEKVGRLLTGLIKSSELLVH